ncbi:family 2 encapsulin nanocompartment cargo protein terpene cyclase [Streptomyces sp. ISL-100]|uniref:family 2 encapsulin nanocompartment cargo protein terpene cyclase n=1 Tax=Streptomyces sp. ISL-100 TaxID=2819173 RepID=UPI001BECAD3A|nr:family 2 encapsulin nanocompartment cargo protein terpene cyclase [Streptomyces sp. ISL-100]MBT2395962.1 Camphene synthase [Streptomyces sp. ISL-100]
MSLFSRAAAPAAGQEMAGLVAALLSDPRRPGRRDVLAPPKLSTTPMLSPMGLRPARSPAPAAGPGSASASASVAASASASAVRRLLAGPAGLGTSAVRFPAPAAGSAPAFGPASAYAPASSPHTGESPGQGRAAAPARPALYCPPAVRDDPALGEVVNERLVAWAEEVGIYPGQLDKVRSANFGRLMMLGHPETDDPDRLLAAAKCGLSEWAVDDHIVDGEVEEARHDLIGQRLAICHSVIDQAQLPLRYAPQLEQVVQQDPVAKALRSALNNLLQYATTTQVRRLRHELAIMFVAYNQEANWHTTGQTPPVWEYLMHRHENSFIPCMVLVDAIAGYEVPMAEFSDPRVRRTFNLAGTATVLMNDLYSMGKEDPTDFSLPMLIAAEEQCSLREAVDLSVEIHDELMHTFEAEAAALALVGSPELRRFLAGTWAWVGGNREWHAGSARYA